MKNVIIVVIGWLLVMASGQPTSEELSQGRSGDCTRLESQYKKQEEKLTEVTKQLDQLTQVTNYLITASTKLLEDKGRLVTSVELGYSYWLELTARSWQEGKATCRVMGYHLARIENHEEDEFIKNLIRGTPGTASLEGIWLDGTDQGHEGVWTWTDPKVRHFLDGYTNWHTGQPNNFGGNQHCCGSFKDFDYRWGDAPCSNRYPVLCKRII